MMIRICKHLLNILVVAAVTSNIAFAQASGHQPIQQTSQHPSPVRSKSDDFPAWPAFVAAETVKPSQQSPAKHPGYLQWQSGESQLTRVSDAEAFGVTADHFAHPYAKVSPWNADNSLAMLFASKGQDTKAVLLDGRTLKFRKLIPATWVGGRWSTVDPQIYYQITIGDSPKLYATNVITDQRTIVFDFAPQGYVRQAHTSMFGGEGNQSLDDRIWVLQLEHKTRGWELVVWDKTCLLYTSPSPRDATLSRMPSSA